MKKLVFWIVVIAIFVALALPFLLPSYSAGCTVDLLNCVEAGKNDNIFKQLGQHLLCVYHNVVCVLGGLFSWV